MNECMKLEPIKPAPPVTRRDAGENVTVIDVLSGEWWIFYLFSFAGHSDRMH
jgi:hypothetical protein